MKITPFYSALGESLAVIIHNNSSQESTLRAKILLHIAANDGCTSKELESKFGINQATVSRATRELRGLKAASDRRRRGKRQLISVDPLKKKHGYYYELTEAGRRYLQRAFKPLIAATATILASSF